MDVSSGNNLTLTLRIGPKCAATATRNGNVDPLVNAGTSPAAYSKSNGYVSPSWPIKITFTLPHVPAPLHAPVVTSNRYMALANDDVAAEVMVVTEAANGSPVFSISRPTVVSSKRNEEKKRSSCIRCQFEHNKEVVES